MNFKVVGIGEVLWDLLPGGKQLGGAPANFACQACALGAESRIISRIGSDTNGRELIERLEGLGVHTDCVEVDATAATGTVSVEIGGDGQPQFIIHENVAWDYIAGEGRAPQVVAEAHAVCFGTLAQRSETSRAAIRTLLASAAPNSLRILDVNLRQHFFSREIIEQSLGLANILKVNETELPLIAAMFEVGGGAKEQISQLAAHFQLRVVACTRGARGSLLMTGERWSDHPGVPTEVVDAVGAGDAFTAAMTLGLLAGWNLDDINQRANEVAAFVASRAGATPELPERLRAPFRAK